MKECELCKYPARTYCESDQASLCWDCDAKVHCANFLVARHSRSLLCHVCQSATPWKASGAKLGQAVSVCERCVNNCNGRDERDERGEVEGQAVNDGEDEIEEETEDDDDDEDEDDSEDDEDGENQVVPWSSTPPPPITSSSSGDESSSSAHNRG
ncbi:zinc finger protein CONSTANS-LIKE 4-like [Telopea speciosissima]|uniref:zinc finger protein CONSTANS-LIKE 4-like n=1 Tax=Telopea speciosissima TaxID=54955 RepID=UPI001CC5B144|nr:zinc finger protein CONSTANS-LIKE 4-like [Telopea speciosissima]